MCPPPLLSVYPGGTQPALPRRWGNRRGNRGSRRPVGFPKPLRGAQPGQSSKLHPNLSAGLTPLPVPRSASPRERIPVAAQLSGRDKTGRDKLGRVAVRRRPWVCPCSWSVCLFGMFRAWLAIYSHSGFEKGATPLTGHLQQRGAGWRTANVPDALRAFEVGKVTPSPSTPTPKPTEDTASGHVFSADDAVVLTRAARPAPLRTNLDRGRIWKLLEGAQAGTRRPSTAGGAPFGLDLKPLRPTGPRMRLFISAAFVRAALFHALDLLDPKPGPTALSGDPESRPFQGQGDPFGSFLPSRPRTFGP